MQDQSTNRQWSEGTSPLCGVIDNTGDRKMKDWKDHDGGECPVEKGTLVDVQHRDGDIFRGYRAEEPGGAAEVWTHNSCGGDIIRYRVAEPETNDTATVLRQIADEIERVGVERAHEGFEVREPDDDEWQPMIKGCMWADLEYNVVRPRPRTIQIGDHTVPEPLRVAKHLETIYFPNITNSSLVSCWPGQGASFDRTLLLHGLAHDNYDAALQHARALIAVSGGEVGE